MTDTQVPTATYTIFTGRKVGLPNYGNKESGIHAQVVVPVRMPLDEVEVQIDAIRNFIEAKNAQFLGLNYATDEATGRVVVVEEAVEAAKKSTPRKSSSGGAKRKSGGGTTPDRDELWKTLQAEIDGNVKIGSKQSEFWDNRQKKADGEYSPKAPDFKHKASEEGLWIRPSANGGGAPTWFNTDSEVI